MPRFNGGNYCGLLMMAQEPMAQEIYDVLKEHPSGLTMKGIREHIPEEDQYRINGIVNRMRINGLIVKAGRDQSYNTIWVAR